MSKKNTRQRLKKLTKEQLSTPTQNIKPVSTKCAPIKTLCEVQEQNEPEILNLLSKLQVIKNKNFTLYAIASTMVAGACRVSEVLQIESKDINSLGQIKIKAKKKGNDRIIDVSELRDFYLKFRNTNSKVYEGFSRFYVYREFKKLGISFKPKSSTKFAVTHAIRHLVVCSSRKEGFKDDTIKRQTGHKTQKMVEKYGKK